MRHTRHQRVKKKEGNPKRVDRIGGSNEKGPSGRRKLQKCHRQAATRARAGAMAANQKQIAFGKGELKNLWTAIRAKKKKHKRQGEAEKKT